MTFFNVFSEISKNQGNFKQWEQDKADLQAKRESHFAQNPPSQEQLKQAKEFGRVVVDSVDFMDAQSENKSESVEMAVEMPTSIAAATGSIATFIGVIKNQNKRIKELENCTDKAHKLITDLNNSAKNTNDPNPEHLEIIKDLKEHKLISHNKKWNDLDLTGNIDGYYNIFDKKKFNKLSEKTKDYFKDVVTKDAMAKAQKVKGGANRLLLLSGLVGIGISAIGQVVGTFLQIKASRVARYQAREALKDPKNFVQYNDEQREESKKYIAGITIPKEKKSGSIRDIVSLMKDYGAYEAESEKLDNTHFYNIEDENPEEAYKKQKITTGIISKINNQAEEYSEDMETAAGVILGSSVLGGALFGKMASVIIKKIDIAKQKADIKEAEKAGKTLEDFLADKAKDAEKLEEAIDKNIKGNRLKKIKKLAWDAAKQNPTMFGVVLSSLIAIPIATKIQKEASRAGRYKAKRELEENPQNFIYVEQSDLNKQDAKGIVPKEGFMGVVKFVPEAIKTIREYDKYKKTTLRQKKAEAEALKMTKISDKQLKEAQNLQTRLYKSFDIIDDHCEEYSEKVEAACEVTKDLFNGIAIPVALGVPGMIILKSPHKAAKPITGILAGVFKNFSSFAKKYTKNLGDHAINKLTNKIKSDWKFREIAFAEKDIDEALSAKTREDFVLKMKIVEEKLKTKLKDYKTENYLNEITKFKDNNFVANNSDEFIDEFIKNTPKNALKENFMQLIEKRPEEVDEQKYIERLKENFDKFAQDSRIFSNADFKKLKDKDILKIKNNIATFIKHLPEEELTESFGKLAKFASQKNTKTMIMNTQNINLETSEQFVTKDIKPIFYTIVGTLAAGMIGLSYSIESYLSKKTKEAGRLGTMKAIQDLDAENEKALEMSKAKKSS